MTDALLGLLARTQDRPLASIEEALLIRELMQGLGLSQHDLARRCGRDVSWVSRRLQLLSGLPDAALTAVRGGKLSSWSANRVVVPLARANAEHADRLLATLADAPLSTRELNDWFEHYQKASRGSRDRMVSHPRLFLDALRENVDQRAGLRLRDGPEGECAADLRCIEAVLARLRKRVAALRPLPLTLVAAVPRLRAAIGSPGTRASNRHDDQPRPVAPEPDWRGSRHHPAACSAVSVAAARADRPPCRNSAAGEAGHAAGMPGRMTRTVDTPSRPLRVQNQREASVTPSVGDSRRDVHRNTPSALTTNDPPSPGGIDPLT